MDEIIAEKEKLINLLLSAQEELDNSIILYTGRKADLWLNTDFNKELNTNKPTVDMKKSYVSYYSLLEKERKLDAERQVEYLKYLIGICDDKLKVKYE